MFDFIKTPSIEIDASSYGIDKSTIIPISVNGVEHMSQSFSYEVLFFTPKEQNPQKIMDSSKKTVTITLFANAITGTGKNKIINGHIVQCKALGMLYNGQIPYYEYKIVVESFMSLLDMNQDCQVFLNMTVYEIVEKILKKTKPGNTVYPAQSDQKKIPYTVQYGESDAYFISRLLQSAGISYFFTMEKGKHTMKFYEKYDDYLPLDTVNENDLQFHRENGVTLKPATVMHTAYNYDNPDFNMTKEKVVKPSGFGAVFKHFGGQSSIDGPTYSTKLFSEQVASEENLLLGSVKRIDFTPGYSITTNKNVHYGIISTELDVIEPSVLHFKDKNFLDSQKNYTASFKCMSPVTVKYRSSFPYINPQIPGIQIAYVVGDKETYMDKQGRVQVKFLWDRHFSQNQEQLYIRMMQPSASKEAGTHYKVYPGDEVLVSFLEGGVEEPVIIGALYNGKHEQSIPEEGAGDSHGFKTLGGHHVAYIDKKGSEEISISSAKKMSLKSVENCEITQKNLDIKTTELVKIEQKQLEVNTTDSLAIKVGITDVKIDKQGSIELSVGSFKMKIDGMAGIIAISGASATSISGTLNVDTVVAKSVIRGGTAL